MYALKGGGDIRCLTMKYFPTLIYISFYSTSMVICGIENKETPPEAYSV